jgi:hypothetical protein
MGRIGISYQDVATAILKLQEQSKPPTVDNVREVLKTGSKSTIARLLREWKQQHGLLKNHNDGSLPTELMSMIKEFWLKLQNKTDGSADNHQQEYDAALHEIQQQLDQYKDKDAAWWNRVQILEEKLQLQNEDNKQLNAVLIAEQQEKMEAKDTEWQGKIRLLEEKLQLQNEDNKQLNAAFIAEQQEKIETTEQLQALQFSQLESEAENERLRQLLKHAQVNLEHYQTTIQQIHLEHESSIEQKYADHEQKLLQMQQQIERVTREKTFLEGRCGNLDKEYGLLMTKHAELESQTQELQAKHSKLELDCARISQNYARISQDCNVQRQALEAKNNELTECQLRLKKAEDHVDYLQNTLFATEDKLIALQDDYLSVSQEKATLEGYVRELRTRWVGER